MFFEIVFYKNYYNSQEKLKTMLLQNFGGKNKEYYGIFDTGNFFFALSISDLSMIKFQCRVSVHRRRFSLSLEINSLEIPCQSLVLFLHFSRDAGKFLLLSDINLIIVFLNWLIGHQ